MSFTRFYTTKNDEKARVIEEYSSRNCDIAVSYEDPPSKEIARWETLREPYVMECPERFLFWKFTAKAHVSGLYKIYAPYSYKMLEKWWYCGNWHLWYPAKVIDDGIDTFRSTDAQIQAYMEKHGLELLIDSFHDDTEWNICTLRA